MSTAQGVKDNGNASKMETQRIRARSKEEQAPIQRGRSDKVVNPLSQEPIDSFPSESGVESGR